MIIRGNIYLWLVMKKSLVSRTRRFTYFQILCYALERCVRNHNQLLFGKKSWRGSKIHHRAELWTQLTENRWNSRIHHIAAPQQSSRVHIKNERKARRIYRTDHLHVDVQRHLMGISRQRTGMRINAKLVSMYARRFSPGGWSFFGLGSEKKWYSTHGSKPWWMGQNGGKDDDQIRRKQTPNLPIHESIVQRSTQEQRWWKIINTLLCRWWYDWNCLSHNHFC